MEKTFKCSSSYNFNEIAWADIIFINKITNQQSLMIAQTAFYLNKKVILDICDFETNNVYYGFFKFLCDSISLANKNILDVYKDLENSNWIEIQDFLVPDNINLNINHKKIALSKKYRHLRNKSLPMILKFLTYLKGNLLVLNKKNKLKKLVKFFTKRLKNLIPRFILFCIPSKVYLSNLFSYKTRKVESNDKDPTFKDNNFFFWFGNHSEIKRTGLYDLVEDLRMIAHSSRSHLPIVVMTNNFSSYSEIIYKKFAHKLNLFYFQWSEVEQKKILKKKPVVLLSRNASKVNNAKTLNRTFLSLSYQCPVFMNINSPNLNKDIVFSNDIEECFNENLVSQKYNNFIKLKKILSNKISNQWNKIFSINKTNQSRSKFNTVITCNLIQDIQYAISLYIDFKASNLKPIMFINIGLLEKINLGKILKDFNVNDYFFFNILNIDKLLDIFNNVKSLMAITESNLEAHFLVSRVIRRAKKKNIKTYTIQHGLENIGLTFDDKLQPIQKIKFFSDIIFTWNNRQIFSEIHQKYHQKLIQVGKVDSIFQSNNKINTSLKMKKIVIGVFENLHWHIYTQSFRNKFLKMLEDFGSDDRFLVYVKTHDAGMWSNKINKKAKNIIFVSDFYDDGFKVSEIINNSKIVISTPSTAALDACILKKPIVLFSNRNLHSSKKHIFDSLAYVSDFKQATEFIEKLDDSTFYCDYLKQMQKFVNKNVCSLNANYKIINHIKNELPN